MEGLESLQMSFSFLFFTFTFSFLSFSLLLLLFQSLFKPIYCTCHLCKSYLNSTWRADFPNLSDWYSHLLKLSPSQTIHIHVINSTITANPANVEYILNTNFPNFPKGKPFSSILGDLLGNGIFNVDGDLWKFQRKMASLELGNMSVRCYAFSVVNKEIQERLLPLFLSNSVGCSSVVMDLQDVFRRFSFDTICKLSFGLDPKCLELLSLPVSEFANAFDTATSLSASRAASVAPIIWKLKRLFSLGSERELKKAIGLVNALAEEVIRQRRKLVFNLDQHDLLSRFMGSVPDDDKLLRDIVVSFLLAGRDTVASGLTTTFLLLCNHPRVLEAMREEIDAIIGRSSTAAQISALSFDQLRSMNYVHAVLYESLRLYPPVQFDSKFCLEDDILADGTFVNKGTRVTYHPYAMGRMEEIWGSDCGVFRPERWLRRGGGVFVPENPYRYPVFQGGVRVCLGKELAVMEMKAVMVMVVREFDVQLVAPALSGPTFVPGLTATLRGGLPVRARQRRRM